MTTIDNIPVKRVLNVTRLGIFIKAFLVEPCLPENLRTDFTDSWPVHFLSPTDGIEEILREFLCSHAKFARNSLSDVIATDLDSRITLSYPELGFNYHKQM